MSKHNCWNAARLLTFAAFALLLGCESSAKQAQRISIEFGELNLPLELKNERMRLQNEQMELQLAKGRTKKAELGKQIVIDQEWLANGEAIESMESDLRIDQSTGNREHAEAIAALRSEIYEIDSHASENLYVPGTAQHRAVTAQDVADERTELGTAKQRKIALETRP